MTTTPETDRDALADSGKPAAPSSQLSRLRDRRQKVVDALQIDYAVPRYDPPIWVRFRPVGDGEASRINKSIEKSKDDEVNVIANAKILANACLGVFEIIDGKEVSLDPENPDELTKFDERLARELGLPESARGVDVVRALYATDGDVIATAQRLSEFSGYSLANVEEREDREGN